MNELMMNDLLNRRLREFEQRLERFAAASLEVLVNSFEARDPYMADHSVRVAQLSASLADALGRDEDEIEAVRLAGRLHDIGMLVISDRVTHREGPLTPQEFEQIQQHPLTGYDLLQPYPHLGEVARFVRGHHERWDGHGYPDGLAAQAIPWGARIIGVVETYDALVTRRSYTREIASPSEAIALVRLHAGQRLDPEVCEALCSVIGRGRTLEFVLGADRPTTGRLAEVA